MDTNFYDYLEKNGLEAYDKMAKELADQLNAARQKYEDDQKKKAEAEAAKKAADEAAKKDRELAVNNLRDALLAYYGKKLTDRMATECAKGILEATDILVGIVKQPKVEVIKDEDTPDGGHVFAAKLHDCADLYDIDTWDKLFKEWL